MNPILSTLVLPPNIIELTLAELRGLGQPAIIATVKDATIVPTPISLWVYENNMGEWKNTQKIELGQQAMFWQASEGLWGLDSNGVIDLLTGTRIVSTQTWLEGLGATTPKQAHFVEDMDQDGKPEFLIQSAIGLTVYSMDGREVLSSQQPVDGSIREYGKTGGYQMEIAQRSRPLLLADFNGDVQKEIVWLKGNEAVVDWTTGTQLYTLPVTVEPQYGTSSNVKLEEVRFLDLNSDKQVDLVWRTRKQGESWFGSTSQIHCSFLERDAFSALQTLDLEQSIVEMKWYDHDGDGVLDLWVFGTDLGLSSLSRTLISQQARLHLQIYPLTSDGLKSTPVLEQGFNIPLDVQDVFDWEVGTMDGKAGAFIFQDGKINFWKITEAGFQPQGEWKAQAKGELYFHQTAGSAGVLLIWEEGRTSASVLYWSE